MGRIAGPLSKHRRADLWKLSVKARRVQIERERLRPELPLVAPPAMRRRAALLWAISVSYPEGLTVGWEYCPPYTPDMRWLVGRGYLKLSRVRLDGLKRENLLTLSPAGLEKARGLQVSVEDKQWILASWGHSELT